MSDKMLLIVLLFVGLIVVFGGIFLGNREYYRMLERHSMPVVLYRV